LTFSMREAASMELRERLLEMRSFS
jgi:hypothetical protein